MVADHKVVLGAIVGLEKVQGRLKFGRAAFIYHLATDKTESSVGIVVLVAYTIRAPIRMPVNNPPDGYGIAGRKAGCIKE